MADIKNSTPTVAAVAMSAPGIELQEPTFNVPNTQGQDDDGSLRSHQ